MRSEIICGVDGSRASWAAIRLASALARRLSLRLQLVHVTGSGDEAHQLARAHELKAQLGGNLPPGVVLRIQTGSPAERLLAVSRNVAMLVIGTEVTAPCGRR